MMKLTLETDQLSPAQFETWGRAMGELHALAVEYTGPCHKTIASPVI